MPAFAFREAVGFVRADIENSRLLAECRLKHGAGATTVKLMPTPSGSAMLARSAFLLDYGTAECHQPGNKGSDVRATRALTTFGHSIDRSQPFGDGSADRRRVRGFDVFQDVTTCAPPTGSLTLKHPRRDRCPLYRAPDPGRRNSMIELQLSQR